LAEHLGCQQQAFEYMTSLAVLWPSFSVVCPKFVKDFDKALSKYCLFDLFSAIKHKRKMKFEEIDNGICYVSLTFILIVALSP
jgi:hypothetical protein